MDESLTPLERLLIIPADSDFFHDAQDAAAEIERLTAERDGWRRLAQVSLDAITTGRNEPLMVARDALKDALQENSDD